jgi:hypothetical protein
MQNRLMYVKIMVPAVAWGNNLRGNSFYVVNGTHLKCHCWIQPKRCVRLPKTINGERRPGGRMTRLMKPLSRNEHIL